MISGGKLLICKYIRKLLFDVIFLLKAPPVMIRSKNPFVILMASGKVG